MDHVPFLDSFRNPSLGFLFLSILFQILSCVSNGLLFFILDVFWFFRFVSLKIFDVFETLCKPRVFFHFASTSMHSHFFLYACMHSCAFNKGQFCKLNFDYHGLGSDSYFWNVCGFLGWKMCVLVKVALVFFRLIMLVLWLGICCFLIMFVASLFVCFWACCVRFSSLSLNVWVFFF